jgi:hypothetical protein
LAKQQEAAQVYRDDLAPGRHPGNIWALHGLATCLARLLGSAGGDGDGGGGASAGDVEAALLDEQAAIAAQLEAAQSDADIEIKASCACARVAWEDGDDAHGAGSSAAAL